ncbi:DEAD/DEAH box helicase [Mycobacterium sp. ITM-2016-00317]|uniref:DEAD/DEAH box helicase n=1 Tax=Mycobacterium sp. ITM-2016-00317 TaxID=2099694 RepID=UPI00287FF217|nr:DEAD/DEAH box helicase [Mycobacterium sp. ITM-2016-00317]WNG88497.1 DEAD/DEAH box helicase [Mycobacterium sp. ITM-2016-00317]
MLELRLAVRSSMVEVSANADLASVLAALRTRFPNSSSTSNLSFEVNLDDFLSNIVELATWPVWDEDIRWQPELLAIVETNAGDSTVAEGHLANPSSISPPLETAALGTDWDAPLTGFQQRDVGKLLGLAHGANFSVPGAGKTRAALAVFQARRKAGQVRRMLVVSPKSAFESWQFEVEECLADGFDIAIMSGPVPPPGAILLVNYERLPDAVSALQRWVQAEPTLMVLDEAHRMKLGGLGAWGSACLALGPYAASRLILTGTPAPNGVTDLANLLSFVWPGQGRRAVLNAVEGNDLRTASKLLSPLFVRTTKHELDLPPVTRVVRRVTLPFYHRELYDALLGQASGRLSGETTRMETLGRVLMYLLMAATSPALLSVGASRYEPLPYRVPPLQPAIGSTMEALMRDLPHHELSPKYAEVAQIVRDNANKGRKTLVWSTFVRNLTSLGVVLGDFNPALIHGGTEDREAELRKFRKDEGCFVLLSNPATLGEGVSLHHDCHDAVYVDRDFAAGRFMQSLDRIHRLGLAPDVETRITVLVADATIDEVIEQRLAAKLAFMGGILDDPAVLALTDLDEEPAVAGGMSAADAQAVAEYVMNPHGPS